MMNSTFYLLIALACLVCLPVVTIAHAQTVSVLNGTQSVTAPPLQPSCSPCNANDPQQASTASAVAQPIPVPNTQTTTTTANGRELTITIPPIHITLPNQTLAATSPVLPASPAPAPAAISPSPSPQVIVVKVPVPTAPAPAPVPIITTNNDTNSTNGGGGCPIGCGGHQKIIIIREHDNDNADRQPLVITPDPFNHFTQRCPDGGHGEAFRTLHGTPVTICPRVFHNLGEEGQQHSFIHHSSNSESDNNGY